MLRTGGASSGSRNTDPYKECADATDHSTVGSAFEALNEVLVLMDKGCILQSNIFF